MWLVPGLMHCQLLWVLTVPVRTLAPETLNVPFAQGRVVTRATAAIAAHIPPLLCMHPTGQRRKLPR